MPFDGTVTIENDVVRILKGAKALIGRPGLWNKGAMVGDGGGLCALAALRLAAAGNMESVARGCIDPAYEAAMRALCHAANGRRGLLPGVYLDEHEMLIADFNDSPATTHEQVMAAFDRAVVASA